MNRFLENNVTLPENLAEVRHRIDGLEMLPQRFVRWHFVRHRIDGLENDHGDTLMF